MNISLHTNSIETLKQYWGYDDFRPMQQEAVNCVLQNQDSIVVLPTGGGKSICFQVPAMIVKGMAVVISPLISLMKDQVDALTQYGIPAARLDSTLHPSEQNQIIQHIQQSKIKILYPSPERMMSSNLIPIFQQTQISFIAIDEAHCVSMWGHDFRPEYRQLGELKKLFPDAAVHAYTATATEQVRTDIAKQLRLSNPEIWVGSFDRPNLFYKIEKRNQILSQIKTVIERHPNEQGIIYCIRRKEVEQTCQELNNMGYSALPYHAGINDTTRKNNQDQFMKEEVNIIVATVAFGMGIDKSNVRFVIHTGMPKSVEHYQQESGRAGRDNLEAECCLFYSGSDYGTWKFMMNSSPEAAKEAAIKKLNDMYDFCSGVTCRHRALVEYFGQPFTPNKCNACDVCCGEMNETQDALIIAQKILSCIKRIEERFGAEYTASVLTGSKEKRILENDHHQLSTYAILKEHSKPTIRSWIEQLVSQNYLDKSDDYNVLSVTADGQSVLKGKITPLLLQPSQTTTSRTQKTQVTWEGVDQSLFEELRQLRKSIADEKEVPPFVIFHDSSLRDMAKIRPTSIENFNNVSGVGQSKTKNYGTRFTELIQKYCTQNQIRSDVDSNPDIENTQPVKETTVSMVKQKAFELFKQGMSVKTTAELINRAPSTTYGYLIDFIRLEHVTHSDQWVETSIAEKIIEASKHSEDGRLKPIFQKLNEEISYDEIKIVLACYRNQVDT